MLEQERIPIDAIAGTSMGAIVGGLYATGMSAVEIETAVRAIDWENVFSRRVERQHLTQRRKEEDFEISPVIEFGLRDGELRAPVGAASSRGLETLLRRYKYLYLTSRQDRQLLTDVEKLRDRVANRRDEIVSVRDQLDFSRNQRADEVARFARLADAREQRLGTLQRSAKATDRRLAELERDASRLNDLIASLERTRLAEAARARRSPTTADRPIPGAISTASIGRLDWPVEGNIVYRFGRQTLPSGGVIRWNGIGISAPAGSPVHAVEAGRVRLVETIGTYGLTVVVAHGNGYYSIYSHLSGAAVQPGVDIVKGQTIGTVGGQNTDYGAHLHFEIRGDDQVAVDPLTWLRRR